MDTDRQADEAWVLSVQRKLYQQSKAHPEEVWRDLWGWLTDPRMIHHAWRRVASNRGRRSAGIDGLTVDRIQRRIGERGYLDGIGPICALAHTGPVQRGESSSPRLENQGNSDPWASPRSRIASFRARSKRS